jgi:hypothetical protein
MPKTCFEELLSPAVLEDENGNDEHNGKNMEAINIILRFLDHRITKAEVRRKKQQVEMKNFFNRIFRDQEMPKKLYYPFFNFSYLCVNQIER